VTYHGPGQLVLYPMLNLRRAPYEQDLHWYLRQIEEVIIRTLRRYGVESNRDEINTGVWVGSNKIAAVGVSSSRWITTHGCALNVKPDLEFFNKEIITPCGIEERDVTSLYDLMGDDCPSVQEVASVVIESFGVVFGVDMVEGDSIKT
jgi:lipoyl(octanoyl) transferase